MLSTVALLLADARTPTGTYAHSGGLEAAVSAGLQAPTEVAAFLRGRLFTVAASDAALAAAAAAAAWAEDHAALETLDDEALARCPSPPLRAAAGALGRSLLRSAERIWPAASAITDYRARSIATPRPVALGVVGAGAGLPPHDVATVSLYDDLAGVATAAVKLLPIDTASALSWVAGLAPELERLAATLAHPGPAAELPSASAVLIDLRAPAHHIDQRRLFVS